MGAVSNITEFGNSVNVTDVLAAGISPALVKANCMMAVMHTEGLPAGTMTAKLTKKGYLTAAALAEATALAPDANGELTDSSVSATIAKCAVVSGVSVEQGQFGSITADRIAAEHGAAIARYVDNDALSLFSGLSTSVTSASILTIDDVMLGQFNIPPHNATQHHTTPDTTQQQSTTQRDTTPHSTTLPTTLSPTRPRTRQHTNFVSPTHVLYVWSF